jgi:predicted MFS family arabinose efflux permease
MNATDATNRRDAGSPVAGPSMWSPLRRPVFRSVWTAWVVSSTGIWMQIAGAAWLMTSLTPSPLLVALMQTATSLPVFLVGLPAGALADIVDRRKLLLATQTWIVLCALTLGLLTLAGLVSAWTLLAFTFLMGLGAALTAPAWQAMPPDLVEREELQPAIALIAGGFHAAQAVGPAIAGVVVASVGPAGAFLLNAVSYIPMLRAILRWRPARSAGDTPPEDMLGASVAGIRYVRDAPALQAVLVRIGVFTFGASALWSLLPVVARRDLGLDPTGYGIVLGSLGFGAVCGVLVLPRLRRSLSLDGLTAAASLVFAGATLAAAHLRFAPLVALTTAAGGVGWLVVMSCVGFAAQIAAPGWVRARAMAVYQLVFQGLLGTGSLLWGALAQQFGTATSLTIAALALAGGVVAARRWPLRQVQRLDLTPSGHWPGPRVALTPEPEDGPVLVTVEYRVPAERADDFLAAMDEMRRFRRREGAVRWDLFRDLGDPDRYLETFLVVSWGEHLRQHARVTVEDQAIEARAFSFLQPGVQPVAAHLIAAHVFAGRSPDEVTGGALALDVSVRL